MSNAFTELSDWADEALAKGAKPPSGYTAIPGGKKGGYRKPKAGGGWSYVYTQGSASRSKSTALSGKSAPAKEIRSVGDLRTLEKPITVESVGDENVYLKDAAGGSHFFKYTENQNPSKATPKELSSTTDVDKLVGPITFNSSGGENFYVTDGDSNLHFVKVEDNQRAFVKLLAHLIASDEGAPGEKKTAAAAKREDAPKGPNIPDIVGYFKPPTR